jgi:hypothetical protein
MQKTTLLKTVSTTLLACIATSANAELHGRLPTTPGGTDWRAFFDDKLGIAWAANPYLARNSAQDLDGDAKMTWDLAVEWAGNLAISGVTPWRLPSVDVNDDDIFVDCKNPDTTEEDCRDDEYGHLYWYGDGTVHGEGVTTDTPAPFDAPPPEPRDVANGQYWSSTVAPLSPDDRARNYSFRTDDFGGRQVVTLKTSNLHAWAVHDGDIVVPVNIDIKPGSDPNCFNINGHGVIPVAILGAADFDVYNVDVTSLLFGGLEVRVRGNSGPVCSVEDANYDVYPDLVCHFEDDSAAWTAGEGEATLTGSLLNGEPIEGTDSICVVP